MSRAPLDLDPGFLSQGEAMQWHLPLVGVHSAADIVTTVAYLGLAAALIHAVRRQAHFGPSAAPVFTLLAAALAAGAVTHGLAVLTLWTPEYGTSAFAKVVAGGFAVLAAVAFWRSTPRFIPAERSEVKPLKSAAEERLEQRIAELTAANDKLRREMAHREDAEAESRQLNAVLQTQMGELQSLFKALPVGVAISDDVHCQSIRANEAYAEMMGLPQAKNISLSAAPFAAPAPARVLHDGRELAPSDLPMQRAIAQNAPVRDFELAITRPDGATLDVIANAVPLRDATGRPCGCVATYQDFSAVGSPGTELEFAL